MSGRRPLRVRSASRPLLALLLCAAALAPATAAGAASDASRAPGGPTEFCTAPDDPALARDLARALAEETVRRPESVAVRVTAPGRGLSCSVDERQGFDAASLAKVLLMLATVHRAEEAGRELDDREKQLLHVMITESDNDAASELWSSLGRARLEDFLDQAGAEDTVLGPGRSWGLTSLSARDQDRLMALLTDDRDLIEDPDYPLRLLGEVRADQRWGVSAGTPEGEGVHLKNGWLPRGEEDDDWRVHSSGIFLGGDDGPYRITVLTQHDDSFDSGVRTVEEIARVVHRHLGGSL